MGTRYAVGGRYLCLVLAAILRIDLVFAAMATSSSHLLPDIQATSSHQAHLRESDYKVLVEFVIDKETDFGDSLKVVGNVPELGSWTPTAGVSMDLNRDNVWTAVVNITAGIPLEYKIVLRFANGTLQWMSGPNRRLTVPLSAAILSVVDLWEYTARPVYVTITFALVKHAEHGQSFKVIGNTFQFGNWNVNRGYDAIWHEGDIWKVDVNVAAGSRFEYKFILVTKGSRNVTYMPGRNRELDVPACTIALSVLDYWTEFPAPIVPSPPPAEVEFVSVYFVLQKHCELGQLFAVVGNTSQFGEWDARSSYHMVWHYHDIWIGEVDIATGSSLEYKIVLIGSNNKVIKWQEGSNRILEVPTNAYELVVSETWNIEVLTKEDSAMFKFSNDLAHL